MRQLDSTFISRGLAKCHRRFRWRCDSIEPKIFNYKKIIRIETERIRSSDSDSESITSFWDADAPHSFQLRQSISNSKSDSTNKSKRKRNKFQCPQFANEFERLLGIGTALWHNVSGQISWNVLSHVHINQIFNNFMRFTPRANASNPKWGR